MLSSGYTVDALVEALLLEGPLSTLFREEMYVDPYPEERVVCPEAPCLDLEAFVDRPSLMPPAYWSLTLWLRSLRPCREGRYSI